MNPIVAQEEKKGNKLFPLMESVYLQVAEYRGEKRIDIRKWYFNKKKNEYGRSKNGLNLTVEEWGDFLAVIDDMDSFIQENI